MTSPISANTNLTSPHNGRPGSRGFTLVEMLVVIGIIVVLASLLMPALSKAWKQAQRTSMANDLQAIAAALDAYNKDFRDIPRVRIAINPATGAPFTSTALSLNPPTGAEVLCTALLALMPADDTTSPPGQRPIEDGADGPGFRVRPGGKVYPPYLPTDRFKYGDPTDPFGPSTADTNALRFCLLDRNNQPILYFPRSPANPVVTAPSVPAPYCDALPAPTYSESSLWDGNDNIVWFTDNPRDPANYPTVPAASVTRARKRLRAMLGDRHDAPTLAVPGTPDGVIQSYETPVTDVPFLLWSPGPDERFGPETFSAGDTLTQQDINLIEKNDDVTNFR